MGEFCLRARSRTKATTRLSPDDTWTSDTWLKPYSMSSAPPSPEVASIMTFFASAIALSSSPRLFVSSSYAFAFSMQSLCRSARAAMSAARAFAVTARSPSAAALAVSDSAFAALASPSSLVPNLISSSSVSSINSKLCRSEVSFARAVSNCSCALSKRPWSVATVGLVRLRVRGTHVAVLLSLGRPLHEGSEPGGVRSTERGGLHNHLQRLHHAARALELHQRESLALCHFPLEDRDGP